MPPYVGARLRRSPQVTTACVAYQDDLINAPIMSENKNGKWWLAAYAFPILAVGTGVFFAFLMPFNQDDWLGMRFIIPVAFGVFFGCILSGAAAAISLIKKERLCGLSLLPAIPSVFFAIYVSVLIYQGNENRKRQEAIAAANAAMDYKRQQELISHRVDELRKNPDLITNNKLFGGQNDRDALLILLNDKSYVVTDEVKNKILEVYVLKSMSDTSIFSAMEDRRLLTKEDLEKISEGKYLFNYVLGVARDDLQKGAYKSD
jgi:hypothetical protein